MSWRNLLLLLSAVTAIPALGCAVATPATPAVAETAAAAAPAAPTPPSLPQFLGVPQAAKGVCNLSTRIRSRLGSRFPGLEPKPPLLPITDPTNQGENATPEVKAAAEQKAKADKADQKIKAIHYLTSEGGCGDCFPETEKAIVEALKDCNEEIRFATVKGLRNSAGCKCTTCKTNSCCTQDILAQIYKMAYEVNEQGCHCESSSRIRRLARITLNNCGGYIPEAPKQELPKQLEPVASEGPKDSETEPADSEADDEKKTDGNDAEDTEPKARETKET